ncbi:MAG: hypothetical protein JWP52_3519 [Rhizobacter sp.]|nr:hypothetical protein [Rhizobacter sp.]
MVSSTSSSAGSPSTDRVSATQGSQRVLSVPVDARLETLIDDKRAELGRLDGMTPSRADVVRLALAFYLGVDEVDPLIDGCRNRPRPRQLKSGKGG